MNLTALKGMRTRQYTAHYIEMMRLYGQYRVPRSKRNPKRRVALSSRYWGDVALKCGCCGKQIYLVARVRFCPYCGVRFKKIVRVG